MLDFLSIVIGVGIFAVFSYGVWKLVSEMP